VDYLGLKPPHRALICAGNFPESPQRSVSEDRLLKEHRDGLRRRDLAMLRDQAESRDPTQQRFASLGLCHGQEVFPSRA
jgi:hypothetical protein